MKKQSRRVRVHRRFDGRHRRLMFEQCEERLALSGSSVALFDAAPLEGGFISLNAGDYLSPASNDFLAGDSSISLFRVNFSAAPTIIQFNGARDAWSSSDPISTPLAGTELTVRMVDDGVMGVHPDVDVSLFSVDETILPAADITDEKPLTDVVANGGSESILVDAVDESLPTTEAATKTPLESIAVVDEPGEVSEDYARELLVRSVQLVIGENGIRIELPSPEGGDAFTYSAEGGPIEVALAVVETQQAYEAQVFSAVAALLDHENILAQPTPPVAQPFSGELARSVAFETVGLEPTVNSPQFDDSHASVSPVDAAISASAEATDVEEADTELSRALAFAQWPLVFSAAVGAVLVGTRWRSQSRVAQLPPWRNRQATAP